MLRKKSASQNIFHHNPIQHASHNNYVKLWRQVAQSVERRTLEVEVRGSEPVLGTWWWGRIPPNQPYPKDTAPAVTTLFIEW